MNTTTRTRTITAALSLVMALGGGAALANPNSGSQDEPSSGTSSGHGSGSQASGQKGKHSNSQAPVGFAEEEITSAPLTVQSIDKKNNKLVLRAPDGTQDTVDIPSGTPGFDSLKKGDKVQLDYFAAEVFDEGTQRANGQSASKAGNNSNQAAGSSKSNHIGKVQRIRKADDTGNMGRSGSTGAHATNSGADQGTNR